MEEKKIIIIDGNSLINRAFYAIPLLSTKEGVYTNAVYGFVNMLNKIMEDYSPDYITVAFDRKAPTFRHLEYDEYKAGRKKMPDELAQQLPILKEILDAFKIHRIEIDGFEADDLIGTLAKHAEKNNIQSIIVTGDKDALQLVSKKIKVLITKKGISSLEVYDESGIIDKYGINSKQFIDLKGLMGDQSDNIPGVPGVGEKTALKLLKEFESIENLLANVNQISSNKMRDKIEEYAQQAILSKRLATIVTDVPVDIDLEELKLEKPDNTKLANLFRKLEFHSLMGKLKSDTNEAQEKPDYAVEIISTSEELEKLKRTIKMSKDMVMKLLNDTDPIEKDIEYTIGLAIMVEDKEYYIDLFENPKLLNQLKEVLENGEIKKSGHQIKKDILVLRRHNIFLEGICFDSAIALYLLEPTRTSYEISDISAEYLNKIIPSEEEFLGKGKNKKGLKEIEKNQLIHYSLNWCHTVKKIKEIFLHKLKDQNLMKLHDEVEVPLIEVLADMEFQGFRVDREALYLIGVGLDEKINRLTMEIYQEAGVEFNINSPKQLGEILFDRLGLPIVKKTKTGYSTNIEVLEKLYDRHNIIPKIIDYRQLVKLKSTYIDGLMAVINKKTNKIHSSFNQTVTSTGRISSTEPNLQNIPIKLEAGREIRKVFVPPNEEYLLLDADYSQIELRVLAHISQDQNLIEAFHSGQDIHTATAAKVFGVPLEEVTTLQRGRAKAVNFGIVYGISDYGLSENLHITKKEAQKYIDEYFKMYHGVKKYMDDIVIEGKKTGYVTTLLNRRRYIPELKSSNFNMRSFGERTAMNTPIQGTAADIIKIAMIKVYAELKDRKLRSKLILQVHDELIVQVHKEEIEQVKEIVKSNMENAINLAVPLKVDMNIGNSWYDTK